MKIEFYKSAVCPRCMMAGRVLKKMEKEYPEMEIEFIDIASGLSRMKKAGARMIPAIKKGDRVLSGVFLSPSRIRDFIING